MVGKELVALVKIVESITACVYRTRTEAYCLAWDADGTQISAEREINAVLLPYLLNHIQLDVLKSHSCFVP